MSDSSSNPLRIPRPKIDKLACQAQGVGIFAKGEITLLIILYDACCTFRTLVLYHIFLRFAIGFGEKLKTFIA